MSLGDTTPTTSRHITSEYDSGGETFEPGEATLVADPRRPGSGRGGPRLRGRRLSASVVGLLVFFLMVGLTYALSSPYAAVSDEPVHLIKALGAGNGDLVGAPAQGSRQAAVRSPSVSAGRRRITYIISNSRAYRLPTGPDALLPRVTDTDGCYILKPNHPAVCPPPARVGARAHGSYVGVYPPLPYVLPGLAAVKMPTKHAALYAGRIVNGLTCLGLLAVALLALQHREAAALSVSGVVVALWPNLMFLAWGLNPNGLEIVSALAFYACLLRLVRTADPPRLVWYGVAVTGFTVCASRPTSPIFMAFGLLLVVVLAGPRALRKLFRSNRRLATGTGGVLLLGGLSTAVWDHAMHAHTQPDFRPVTSLIGPALHELPDLLRSSIAALGWSEVRPPESVYTVWFVVLGGLWVLALAVGTWRQRFACLAMPAAFVAVEVVFVILTHPSGFPMGGRYIQAALTALPLLWVEVILLNRQRLPKLATAVLVRALLTIAVATQLDLLYVNGRRWAVGLHGTTTYLFAGAVWSPIGGWLLWAAVAVAGCSIPFMAVEIDSRSSDRLPA